MNNLQYDNLYKFLVSLGVVLIALPIVALAYVLNGDPVLISQTDFDALSEYSRQMIMNRVSISTLFADLFPYVCIPSICAGALFFAYGMYRWKMVQDNLDKKLDAEAAMQILSLMEISGEEIKEKAEAEVSEEISEEISEETADTVPVAAANAHLRRVNRYMEIENGCFGYLVGRYSSSYVFKRNIRMGKYGYDVIGVSQNDDVDLIVEVKYLKSLSNAEARLGEALYRLLSAGMNYEAIAHRNSRLLIIVVTAKRQLSELECLVEECMGQLRSEDACRIEAKCMAEELL